MFAAAGFEQVRTPSVISSNVKIGATHGGISVGGGASHQCCEDFATMRAIPGMVVICPSDDIEARAAVKAAYEYKGPVYMRFCRMATPVINDRPDYEFKIGKGILLRDGTDITIVATGIMVPEALDAAGILAGQGISAQVVNIHTIKPIDADLIIGAAKKTGRVVTVEEHNIIGGLGEAVCAVLSENYPVPVRRVGVNDEFGHSGPAADLLVEYGLCAENIAGVAKAHLQGK